MHSLLFQPGIDSLTGLPGQLKLNGATGFLLHDNCAIFDAVSHEDITDSQGNQITTAKLAVNGQVEQGQVARFPMDLKPDSDGPDFFGLQRRFLAD